MQVSRRDFVKLAGTSAALAGLGAVSEVHPQRAQAASAAPAAMEMPPAMEREQLLRMQTAPRTMAR